MRARVRPQALSHLGRQRTLREKNTLIGQRLPLFQRRGLSYEQWGEAIHLSGQKQQKHSLGHVGWAAVCRVLKFGLMTEE